MMIDSATHSVGIGFRPTALFYVNIIWRNMISSGRGCHFAGCQTTSVAGQRKQNQNANRTYQCMLVESLMGVSFLLSLNLPSNY